MRTIAEILSYNRAYSPHLNDKIFDEDDHMYPDVHDKILEIVDTFMDYAQVEDVKIQDVRLVGSNASYNYNEYSDMDIHIVVDLSKIANPESIAQLYFGEVKHAFKEAYDITIHEIEVELYVEDVNASAITNGIYSVTKDEWVKEPEPMEDPTEEDLDKAEEIEDEIIAKLEKASPEEKDDIIDQLYVMRKDGLATEGETAPANLAFKSLRNKGIIQRAKDELKKFVSKKLSLESKDLKESQRTLAQIVKDLKRGDEIDEVTSDGFDVATWVDHVSWNSHSGADCMFIQIHPVDDKGRGFYYGDIEHDGDFTIAKRRLERYIEEMSGSLTENLDDAQCFQNKGELVDYLKDLHLKDRDEYVLFTKDGIDLFLFWNHEGGWHPMMQIDKGYDTIFDGAGTADPESWQDLINRAIEALQSQLHESRRGKRWIRSH